MSAVCLLDCTSCHMWCADVHRPRRPPPRAASTPTTVYPSRPRTLVQHAPFLRDSEHSRSPPPPLCSSAGPSGFPSSTDQTHDRLAVGRRFHPQLMLRSRGGCHTLRCCNGACIVQHNTALPHFVIQTPGAALWPGCMRSLGPLLISKFVADCNSPRPSSDCHMHA
jgi:hypothetical protein